MKLLRSRNRVNYEDLYHQSQEKLSWHIEALEQKQIQYDILEHVVSKLKHENEQLKNELEAFKKSLLDLPKQLGKNLGK